MEWWKQAIIYQIYPRSFKDSTNNGIGDLRGIINSFDYIKKLGIDAIWFSPFFQSPQADFGYDIADYYQIDPVYGSMSDFDELLQLAHENDIKILLDLVLNHTSSKHKWFIESCKSRDNNYRDYYIWRDGKKPNGKEPPNNWKSHFGGSAWTYDKTTDQWYYHHFLKDQPDLNYRNPKVKEEMFNVVRFWLKKGVDGFRLDVIHTIYEDETLQDNPWALKIFPSSNSPSFLFQNHKYDQDLPETLEFVKELRKVVDEFSNPQRVLIGEVISSRYCSTGRFVEFLGGKDRNGLHMTFNFPIMEAKLDANELNRVISEIDSSLPDPYWPCYPLSNHDRQRMISRCGNDDKKARLMAFLQLTLRGTPVIYYGEEIGMKEGKISRKKILDPVGKQFWYSPIPVGRDGCRTPMQWNDGLNAGFSAIDNSRTWLPVNKDYKKVNVTLQEKDPNSMLNYYRRLIKFRKDNPVLLNGDLVVLPVIKKKILAYERSAGASDKIILVLNTSNKRISLEFIDLFMELGPENFSQCTKVFSTKELNPNQTDYLTDSQIIIDGLEGIAIRLALETK